MSVCLPFIFAPLRRQFINIPRRLRSFGNYEVIEQPGQVLLPPRSVPTHIKKPPYDVDILPPPGPENPEIKSPAQIASMRESCSLARKTLNYARDVLHAGLTTEQLDLLVHEFIISHGAYPSPLNYRNFPKSVCTSINNVVCHGIPDDRPLKDG